MCASEVVLPVRSVTLSSPWALTRSFSATKVVSFGSDDDSRTILKLAVPSRSSTTTVENYFGFTTHITDTFRQGRYADFYTNSVIVGVPHIVDIFAGVFPKFFDVVPAILTALAIFFLLNRDSHIRMLERENKRYKFWKDFYEAQDSLPDTAKFSFDEIGTISTKCKQDLDRSFSIIVGHAKPATAVGILVGLWVTLVLVLLVDNESGFFSRLFLIGEHIGLPNGSWFSLMIDWLMQAILIFVLYQFPYMSVRDKVRDSMLDFQRKRATHR
jgi:hypothetical protein